MQRSPDGRIPESSKLSWMLLATKKPGKGDTGSMSTADRLTKAGYIHQSSAGIYTLLPLAQRVVAKITRIVDEEMRAVGGQRLAMPSLLGPAGWQATGRWESTRGELFTLEDRRASLLLLAPTHEEEVTAIVKHMVRSYLQLPLRLFQVTRKFRDEARPRAGLLRAREFIMKDMYSFDVDETRAVQTFDEVERAYRRCFDRIGVPYAVAEADSGNIGGALSKEFHFVSSAGEDTLLVCRGCGYSANTERARAGRGTERGADVHRVVVRGAEDRMVSEFRVVVPAGHRPNPLKIKAVWPVAVHENLELTLVGQFGADEAAALSQAVTSASGSDSDLGYETESGAIKCLVDMLVDNQLADTVRAIGTVQLGDWHLAQAGDACSKCESGTLEAQQAIEVGHIFHLGDKYSKALDLTVLNQGQRSYVQMGCYGIGISRILQAAAECSNADGRGLRWPVAIAPYLATIVPLDGSDRVAELFAMLADMRVRGVRVSEDNVVVDDRDYLSAGFRLNDAQLLGIPVTVVLGRRFKLASEVEVQLRVPGLTLPPEVAGVAVRGDAYEHKAYVHVDKLVEFLTCAFGSHTQI
ncbi:hypothetical protein IWW50_000570 [Coemansia erecta]|nr:hypothetical protein IWW50_000570 [Coemansia erecta]